MRPVTVTEVKLLAAVTSSDEDELLIDAPDGALGDQNFKTEGRLDDRFDRWAMTSSVHR